MRPLLRYHGAKWRVAPWLLSLLPPHRVYVEPYGGSAAILLRKERAEVEVYNDIEGELVNLFRVVRDHPDTLRARLQATPYAREEYERAYDTAGCPIEQARRTLVRCWMGFGSNAYNRLVASGFRAWGRPDGSHPVGDWLGTVDGIGAVAERLRGVVVEHLDALEVIRRYDAEDTLHYVDPPYVHDTRMRQSERNGYASELTDDDHERLASLLHGVKGMVVLSGYDCELYRSLYGDWMCESHRAVADGGRPRVECVWRNAQCERASNQLSLFGAGAKEVSHE